MPPFARYKLRPGDKVLAYSEKHQRWLHGFRVIELDGKQVWVKNGQRVVKLNIAQVLPDIMEPNDRDIIKLLKSTRKFTKEGPPGVFITETLAPNDIRERAPEFNNARREEIMALLEKGAFEVVMKENVPKNANILGGRFLLALKNVGMKKEICKPRFVVQGHADHEKSY